MKKGLKWIFAFVGAAIFVLLLRCFAITSCIIPAKGMENTLLCGDRILINKWSYGLRAPFLSHFPYHRWGEKRMNLGDIAVFNNPANNTVPIDDREIFISRCVGLPGDTLLVDSVFTLSPIDIDSLNNQSYQFYYRADRGMELDSLLANYTLLTDSVFEMDSIYLLRELPWSVFHDIELNMEGERWIHPYDKRVVTTIRPLIIPAKDQAVKVYPWNRTLLRNTILLHEGKNAEIKNDTLFVDEKPIQEYTFSKDYYWMMSNNANNLSDSRLFGFLPHDHIIGKASSIWFSKEPHTGWFDGYRWNRFFTKVQ